MSLLTVNESGIYCERGGFHIDPWKPVRSALITHGHADHSRAGHEHYLATDLAAPVIRHRIPGAMVEMVRYGEERKINGVTVSFHPAGHIVGSAQIRVEWKGEIWVVAGDHKLMDDGISTPFEPVCCHHFISESTFGLPVYKWKPQAETFAEINAWWRENAEKGVASVIAGYALGKAQRILQGVDHSIGPVFTHGAIESVNEVMREQGIDLEPSTLVTAETEKKVFRDALIISTPSGTGSPWAKKFAPMSIGLCSGWMSLRGPRRRRAVDRGFVLSDHADWPELLETIKLSEAEHIYVTHGYTATFARYLREQGYDAQALETEFEGELGEIGESTVDEETEEAGSAS